jgi:uncharacterized membrane protein
MAKTTRRSGRSWKKILLWVIGICAVVFILIQFVPYGRSSHSNPAATNPFQWTDPQAKAIARTACYDCHSNKTKWWWATNIAPFSWVVQHDVDDGRARLNFSEYDGMPPAAEFQEAVDGGRMPPFQYTLIHRSAKLTDAQKQTLIQGYAAGVAAMNGSGSQSGDSGTGDSSSTPAPTAGATVSTADATAVIQQDCNSCHSSDPALAFRAGSAAEAQALIQDMVQRGAQVSAQDQEVLVQYFTR